MGGATQGRQATEHHAFETIEQLEAWLSENHAAKTELWVRIFKKGSGTPTVTWDDCVVAALAWGWIDGQRNALDEVSFVQRLTPRRPKSSWSTRNCDLADRLIAEGRMQPPGLAHVQAAREDGRWAQAYSGAADMVIPEDFLAALHLNEVAEQRFATLKRTALYRIYYRLQTARRPETRRKRILEMVAQLERGETIR
ncbi:YdeI/OmpD-associated family protein [Deinococcus sonorensis]|uniref:YdeI/OmpD-associated family protein n=2 Tax=Deinococcus sonorensis TaxID=309891 RepID=A0AAU7U562_9DEIO